MKLESDLGQCNEIKSGKMVQLDAGYLTYYQKSERLYLIAFYSHTYSDRLNPGLQKKNQYWHFICQVEFQFNWYDMKINIPKNHSR